MTLEENIKAILECNFSIAKEEVIETATKRIMEQIYRQRDELLKGDKMKHELKILPKWFEDVKHQKKTFEIRRADRDFKVGDTLVLKEYEKGRYTGREIERTIQYIYKGNGIYGLSEDFWILGLKTVEGE